MALEIGKTQKKKLKKKSNTGDFFQNVAKTCGIKMLTIASLPKETAKNLFWNPWPRFEALEAEETKKKTKSFKKVEKIAQIGIIFLWFCLHYRYI